MPTQRIDQLKKYVVNFGNFIAKNNPITRERLKAVFVVVRKNWRSIAIMAPFLLFLYYLIGGFATHKIDKNLDLNYVKTSNGFEVIDAAAALIYREVDDHMFTPSLPIVFPAYILDNMPQYQKGIIHSARLVVKPFAQQFEDSNDLKKAAEFLNYPSNIWLLSKKENLSLAPSSSAQYRKGRKALLRFNQNVTRNPDLNFRLMYQILERLDQNSLKVTKLLEKQIRENSRDWVDFKADDVFYYAQGRLYGYYIILKALTKDFSDEIVGLDAYPKVTSLLKTLEDALALDPMIIRNGSLNAVMTPNHLMVLNFYAMKAHADLVDILLLLKEEKMYAH